MNRLALLLPFISLVFPATASNNALAAPTGLHSDVVFTQYSPLSSSAELARRLVSPLNALRLQQQAAATGTAIREQPVDLAVERFALYVPAHAPAQGYALLVFVPPWNEAKVPTEWLDTLEKQGVILVSAANIGNDTNVLDRRDPVALLAAYNVMARYRVDPKRVYVGGFSGGSRVALRLALGYPDLFHGVLLEAGSDVVGDQIALPPGELLHQFQTSTRVVYLTGAKDSFHEDADRESRHSLQTWCVINVETQSMAWTGHELADAASLARALASLDAHKPAAVDRLANCRDHVDRDLNDQLAQVMQLLHAGQVDSARRQLLRIDAHYGGLAAPRSVEMAKQLPITP